MSTGIPTMPPVEPPPRVDVRTPLVRRRGVAYVTRFAGLARGGAERQALALAHRLSNRGVAMHVVGEDAGRANEFPPGAERRVLLRTSRVRHLSTLVLWARLAAHLSRRRREVSVLHLTGIDASTVVLVGIARALGIRTVLKIMLTGEGGDFENLGRGLARAAKLAALRRVDRCIAVSRRIEADLVECGVRRERIVYLPNGVDLARFSTSRESARRALESLVPGSRGSLVVATAGRLVEQKAFVEMVRVFASARKAAPPVSRAMLVIFGDGPLGPAIAREAQAHGIENVVRLPGHVSDLAPLLPGVDLFVLASRSEGLSNVLLEAMASGVPVVATRTSGTEDVVRDGEDGLVVEPLDDAGLEQAIASLLRSPEARERLGRSARSRVAERWSLDAAAAAHRALYEELSGGRIA